jgi:hypothetical protein
MYIYIHIYIYIYIYVYIGMQQRQTLGEGNEYYMCLSRVRIHAIPINSSNYEDSCENCNEDEDPCEINYAAEILKNIV